MTLENRQLTTEALQSLRKEQRDVSLSALGGVLNVIKQETLTRQDAGSVASARCTFVYTNGIFLHSLPVIPESSASELGINNANILNP